MKRIVFFLGKGGVGKTTLSLAYSLRIREREEGDTLVASLDPAHNLGNFLGMELKKEPEVIEGNLYGVEVEFEEALKTTLKRQVEKIKSINQELKVWNLEGHLDILRWIPGSEEQAILSEIEKISKGRWSQVVFDMPPTGLALRIILLPTLMLFWLVKLKSLREKILDLRETIESIKGQKRPEDRVLQVLKQQEERYKTLLNILKDKSNTHFFIVLEPSSVSLDEAQRVSKSLRENGITPSAVMLNKFKKGDKGDLDIFKKTKDSFHIPVYALPFVEKTGREFEELARLMPKEIF